MSYKVPVGISNKHLHLSRADLEILFGEGAQLTKKNDLKQPGQYAAEECVEIVGPKASFKSVRVIGPLRKETQVELSMTDCRMLGVKAPLRLSGDLKGTPGVKLIGPAGELELDYGVMVAQRHIHLNDEQAGEAGVSDRQIVSVKIPGKRDIIFGNVICRCGDAHEAEFHIDTDEGNAAGASNELMVEIIL